MLSESDSEAGDNDIQLTINEHYAKAYAAKKEREELGKCASFHPVTAVPVHLVVSCRSEGKVRLRCRRG